MWREEGEREGEKEVVGRPNTRHAPQLFRYHGGKRGREEAREREREREGGGRETVIEGGRCVFYRYNMYVR